jgi:hypothetical protein
VAGFSREMKYRSWPYRVIKAAQAGVWELTDTRGPRILHRMLSVDEAVAVHILRDWMCGNAYGEVWESSGSTCLAHRPMMPIRIDLQ